jgi:hypothetical protein
LPSALASTPAQCSASAALSSQAPSSPSRDLKRRLQELTVSEHSRALDPQQLVSRPQCLSKRTLPARRCGSLVYQSTEHRAQKQTLGKRWPTSLP